MIPAKIRWFDSLSGEGMVTLDDGRRLYLHFTAIDGISKNNYAWPAEVDRERLRNLDGRPCTVELWEDTTCTMIAKLVLSN